MPAMEVMAAMGLAGMEVFRYNRENYEFDQDQRFTRDEVRLKMQVELFNLFREDIRDLVELTTSKMNLYHLVGALFIKMICIWFCEGFFEAAVPPFLLCFYYMSQGCSAVYLLFAVWLSMHASVASHSYATRLLTRFVRLPIPGSEQIDVLNARYADFERQGGQMLRIPFMKQENNRWQDRPEMESQGKAAEDKAAVARAKAKANALPGPASSDGDKVAADYLGKGAFAYGGDQDMLGFEAELLKAVEFRTQRHIQLFRRLQAQWQCYDAYARVSMSLGIRMMLQGTSYYLICACWVQVDAPYVASVLVFVFQALALNIATLDIHGINDLSLIGALPSFCAILALGCAKRTISGELEEDQTYPLTLMMYPLEVLWFEMLHWLASPMGDTGFLPRQFRAVLFMDVFSDLNESVGLSDEEKKTVLQRKEKVQQALNLARAALRRWEVVPRRWLTLGQYRLRKQVQKSYNATADAFVDFMEKNQLKIPYEDDRHWSELPPSERRSEAFGGMILGPFNFWIRAGVASQWYWDIENTYAPASGKGVLYEKPGNAKLLDLDMAMSVVQDFKHEVESLTRGFVDENASQQADSESDDGSSSASSLGTHLPETTPLTGRAKDRSNPAAEIEVNRLPWNLASFITRTLQFVWICLGIVGVLRETNAKVFDFQRSYIVEERRLQTEVDLVFRSLDVAWPFGHFFRPEHLSCWSSARTLLVGSPFAQYAVSEDPSGALQLEVKQDLAPKSQIFCAGQCFEAAWRPQTLALRGLESNESQHWRSSGVPRLASGAIVPCASLGLGPDERCLLTAAVEGAGVMISAGKMNRTGAPLAPHAQLALEPRLRQELSALHLDASQAPGRLWMLFSSGRLELWDLLGDVPQLLASHRARWADEGQADPFNVSALCSMSESGARGERRTLFLVGRRSVSQQPVLMSASDELLATW